MRLSNGTIAAAAVVLLAPTLVFAAEGTFDKTLTVSGTANINISTGSGYIHVSPGSDNQIHVIGHVKSSTHWGSGGGSPEEIVKEIVANPPIDQTGSMIRIGKMKEDWHNVSIDYEITAPKNSQLTASTGSGDIRVQSVGNNVKLTTGSGTIEATGVSGSLSLDTGSGDIHADQGTPGDVKAQTGSGSIRLNNIQGALKAQTGSGDVEVSGKPTSPWRVGTGSGSVTIAANNTPFTLDASSGSGGIKTDLPITVEGSLDRHHVTGKVNGGGPTVRVETGSGSIRIR